MSVPYKGVVGTSVIKKKHGGQCLFTRGVQLSFNQFFFKIQLEVVNLQLYRPWQSFVLFADYDQIVPEPVEA